MPRKTKPTLIRLAPTDAAFVIRADGSREIFLPAVDDDADVAPNVEEATMLAFALDDRAEREGLRARWLARVERAGNDDAN